MSAAQHEVGDMMEEGKIPQEVEYVNFTPRLYASLIDSILTALLLLPLVGIIFSIWGGGVSPSAQMAALTQSPEFQNEFSEMVNQGKGMMEIFAYTFGKVDSGLWAIQESLKITIAMVAVILFWHFRSATPGKILLKMKIVDAKTFKKPTTIQWVIRFFAYMVSVLPFCLGFVWMIWDERRQCFHDKIAGTVVIKDKSGIKHQQNRVL